jgi:RNA polymerase sigma-70 factor (ECF subfamily)
VERQREKELIAAAQGGNAHAFSQLYHAYVDKIYRYILFRVESVETAQDLTSEVFLKMVEGLPTYQDRAIPLLVWLYRIAHARVVDHYRRSRRKAMQENIEDIQIGVDAELDTPLQEGYTARQIRTALATLTEGQRRVIELRFMRGRSLEETARELRKSVDAVKAMQYRALQALGAALQRQGFDPDE